MRHRCHTARLSLSGDQAAWHATSLPHRSANVAWRPCGVCYHCGRTTRLAFSGAQGVWCASSRPHRLVSFLHLELAVKHVTSRPHRFTDVVWSPGGVACAIAAAPLGWLCPLVCYRLVVRRCDMRHRCHTAQLMLAFVSNNHLGSPNRCVLHCECGAVARKMRTQAVIIQLNSGVPAKACRAWLLNRLCSSDVALDSCSV